MPNLSTKQRKHLVTKEIKHDGIKRKIIPVPGVLMGFRVVEDTEEKKK